MKPNFLPKIAIASIVLTFIVFIAIAQPVIKIVLAEEKPDINSSSRIINIINHLDRILSNKTLSEKSRGSIELRKQYFEWQATQIVSKLDNPKQLLSQKQTQVIEITKESLLTTPEPTSTRPVGIMKGIEYVRSLEEDAILSEIFLVGKVDETYVIIYSGVLRNDLNQGVIYIFPEKEGRWLKYLMPSKLGLLTIINFNGNRLTLLSDSGEIAYFDVDMRQFILSPDGAISTPSLPYPIP